VQLIHRYFLLKGGTMVPESLLKADEVAQVLGVSRSKAYMMMRRREIPTITIGKNVRVSKEDLQAYIEQNRSFTGGSNE